MIAELARERDQLDEAILALERLAAGKAHRRGRPPAWLKEEIDRQSKEDAVEPESTSRRMRAHREIGIQEKEKDTA